MSIFRRIFRPRHTDSDIAADIESHLAERAQELIDSGMSPEDAYRRARREFGNVTFLSEQSREEWQWVAFEQLVADMRYAARSLWRSPVYSATIILTLALGIGANAAIFNLLHAVILRSLPVPNPQQLRLISVSKLKNGEYDDPIFSVPVLQQMQIAASGRAQISGFSSIADGLASIEGREPETVGYQLVSTNFFQTLTINVSYGRFFTASEERGAVPYPAVISDAFWAKRFGRSHSVLGTQAVLNNTPVVIVGVAPAEFFGVEPGKQPNLWLPVYAQFDLRYRGNTWDSNGNSNAPFFEQPQIRWLKLIVREEPGTMDAVLASLLTPVFAADMRREATGWDPEGGKNFLNAHLVFSPGGKGLDQLRSHFADPLIVLMCAAAMVLLVACANIASLAIARSASRQKEIGIRCSLGAGRGRIIRQYLAETFILASLGGTLSVPMAIGASQLLLRWASRKNVIPLDVTLSTPILLFVLLVSFSLGCIFGVLPAFHALRSSLASILRSQASSIAGTRLPFGRVLITAQVVLSFLLLTGAGLFTKSLMNYGKLVLGFVPDQVLSVTINPLTARFTPEQLPALYQRVLDELQRTPGVVSASLSNAPLAGNTRHTSSVNVTGHPSNPGENLRMMFASVSPGYFDTVGMRLLAGRPLLPTDTPNAPLVAVINESAARRYFPDGRVIGGRFDTGNKARAYQIVGLVADARSVNIHDAPEPMAYTSMHQGVPYASTVEVRTNAGSTSIEPFLRAAIHRADSKLPITEVNAVRTILSSQLNTERLIARLAISFAALALLLACLGIYGVLAYSTVRRTSEIGLRLALGAGRFDVQALFLREILLLIIIGAVISIPLTLMVTRLVRGLLFHLEPNDPFVLVIGGLLLALAGALAAFLPAWRASRVDPMVALRYE
jgi:predicted permease